MNLDVVKAELIEKAKVFVENVVLPQIEVALEKEIEAKADGIVEMVLTKIEALIPGPWDNMVIDPAKPKLKADVKAYLLAQAEKISEKV